MHTKFEWEIEHAFFEDFGEARNWLETRNFKLPIDEMNNFIQRSQFVMNSGY